MSLKKSNLKYGTIINKIETEKSYIRYEKDVWTFNVHLSASKSDIKSVLESLYDGIKVISVNTITRKGKVKRTRRGFSKRSDQKYAIVRLSGDLEKLVSLKVGDE